MKTIAKITPLRSSSLKIVDYLANSPTSIKQLNLSRFRDIQSVAKIERLNKINSDVAEEHKQALSNLTRLTSELVRA